MAVFAGEKAILCRAKRHPRGRGFSARATYGRPRLAANGSIRRPMPLEIRPAPIPAAWSSASQTAASGSTFLRAVAFQGAVGVQEHCFDPPAAEDVRRQVGDGGDAIIGRKPSKHRRQGRGPIRAAARLASVRSRWSLIFGKRMTAFLTACPHPNSLPVGEGTAQRPCNYTVTLRRRWGHPRAAKALSPAPKANYDKESSHPTPVDFSARLAWLWNLPWCRWRDEGRGSCR